MGRPSIRPTAGQRWRMFTAEMKHRWSKTTKRSCAISLTLDLASVALLLWIAGYVENRPAVAFVSLVAAGMWSLSALVNAIGLYRKW